MHYTRLNFACFITIAFCQKRSIPRLGNIEADKLLQMILGIHNTLRVHSTVGGRNYCDCNTLFTHYSFKSPMDDDTYVNIILRALSC